MADELYVYEVETPNGGVYKVVDQGARDLIKELFNFHEYLGVTTSAITEGSTINPVVINGESVTAVAGDVVTLSTDATEWAFSSTGKWQKFGELSGLGKLAFKDKVSASYTPAGTVSKPTFTGSELTSTGSYTPAGSVSKPAFSGSELTSTGSYTPAGSISDVAIGTKTIKQFKTQGTMPTFNVQNHRLIIGDGTLPTGEDVSVGSGAVTSQPTFSGTAATLTVKGTPAGTVSQPTFSGTAATLTVKGTPTGEVSQPTFTGTAATIESE